MDEDLGVRYASKKMVQMVLTRVPSNPADGQYAFDGEKYTFSQADWKRTVIVTTAHSVVKQRTQRV